MMVNFSGSYNKFSPNRWDSREGRGRIGFYYHRVPLSRVL